MNHEGTDCASEPVRPDKLPKASPTEAGLVRHLLQGLDRSGAVVERVAVGSRFVGLQADGRVGLASTLGARAGGKARAVIDSLPGQGLARAAGLLRSDDPLLVSLGLAGLNAGLDPPPSGPGLNVAELLVRLGQGREVAVVGDFPFLARLQEVASGCHLLELREVPGAASRREWEEILGRCQLAVITGTALLTRSLSYFLGTAAQAQKILVGPSTPLAPLLFDYGVEVLAGCRVLDPREVLAGVQAGLPFHQLKRKGLELVCCQRPKA